jgi:hypothetical protein
MLEATPDRGRVRFAEQRDIGGVISTTFVFLRETWRELGLGLLYVAGPVLLLTAVGSYFMQTRLFGMLDDLERADPNDPTAVFDMFGGLVGPSYILAVFGGLVAGILVTAVVYSYLELYRAGRVGQISPGVLWTEASHLLGRSFRVWLLTAAVATLCIAAMALFCLGLVALVAVGPALALTVPAAMLGRRRVGEAFGEGWRLASRAWLPTLGVCVISGLIWYAVSLTLSLPSSIAGLILGLNATGITEVSGATRALMAAGTVLGAFAYLFYAIPLIAIALQFFSLTSVESGGGLVDRVAAMEAPGDEGQEPRRPPPLPSGGSAPAGGFRGRGFEDDA